MAAALPAGAPGAPDRALPGRGARSCRPGGLRHLVRRWRAAASEGSLAGFMSPEQRGLLRETQLVMSLMEGFSDWVMDEVGEQVLPDVAGIRRRFEARRSQRRAGHRPHHRPPDGPGPQARAVPSRRAVRERVSTRPVAMPPIGHLWDGPASLPTDAEMERARAAGWSGVAPSSAAATRPTAAPGPDARLRARRRAHGHRPDAHPVGALPRGGPGAHPCRRAGRPAGERLARGPGRRTARRRRGDAPRAAARGDLRPHPGRAARGCAGSTPRRRAWSAC